MTTEEAYPWLPATAVAAWLKIRKDAAPDQTETLEVCRKAAAEWVQDQRRDLLDEDGAFEATDRVVQAALLVVGRLWSRKDSPGGVVSFAEFGAGSIVGSDRDVRRLLAKRVPSVG